ncbi:hypothetical protein C6501_12120 [Candidatus Poribacteria bacterium]|nr:MAG: hypothetical protein C6501_12120 [Candidatus Poribacteria bacterium]
MQVKRVFLLITFLLSFFPPIFAQEVIQEPPIVRLIYFLPNDRVAQQDIDAKMDTLIKNVQQFYADEMERHGFGRKTFRFETDSTGKTVVHRVNGKFNDAHYHNPSSVVWEEIDEQFDTSKNKNIYLTALDISTERLDTQRCGSAYLGIGKYSYKKALIPASGVCFNLKVTAHELGHAFGLPHDFRNDAYMMSYGKEQVQLSHCTAEWLDVHPAFNLAQFSTDNPTTYDLLAAIVYPPNDIRLRFKITDADILHQARLLIRTNASDPTDGLKLHSCKSLNSESSTIEFIITELTTRREVFARLLGIDINGNSTQDFFSIWGDDLVLVDVDDDGVVDIDDTVPEILEKVSGDNQYDFPDAKLPAPFVVQVRDLNGSYVRQGVPVKFVVIEGGGKLNTITAITDAEGKAETTLTLGERPGTNTVEVSVTWIREAVTFNAVANPANIPDPNLRAAINSAFNRTAEYLIAPADMKALTRLVGENTNISDLTGLELALNLTELHLGNNTVSDITILAYLTKLTTLNLEGNTISDISPLERNTGLGRGDVVTLRNNPLNESALANISALQSRGVTVEFHYDDISGAVPKKTALLPNFPNPFDYEIGTTSIPYHLSNDAEVIITIFDTTGMVVRRLELEHQTAGYYTNRNRAAYWDGRNAQGERVASGIYFYTLTAGDFTSTRKMLIRK